MIGRSAIASDANRTPTFGPQGWQLPLCRDALAKRLHAPSTCRRLARYAVRLCWLGERLGFEKLSLKNEKVRAFFVSTKDQYFSSEIFGQILSFIKKHPRQCKMKDSAGKAMLIIEEIKTVDAAIEFLTQMVGLETSSSNEIISK